MNERPAISNTPLEGIDWLVVAEFKGDGGKKATGGRDDGVACFVCMCVCECGKDLRYPAYTYT